MLLWRLIIGSSLLFVPAVSLADLGNCTENNYRGCARAAMMEAPEDKVQQELRSTSGTVAPDQPRFEPEPAEDSKEVKKPGVTPKKQKRALQVYVVLALVAAGARQ